VPTSATVFFKPSAIIRSLFCNCLSTTTIYRPRKEITRGYQREDSTLRKNKACDATIRASQKKNLAINQELDQENTLIALPIASISPKNP